MEGWSRGAGNYEQTEKGTGVVIVCEGRVVTARELGAVYIASRLLAGTDDRSPRVVAEVHSGGSVRGSDAGVKGKN